MPHPWVDCHTHIFPPDRLGKLIRWSRQFRPAGGPPDDVGAEEIVAELRRAGATRWANLLFPLFRDEAPGLHRFNAELADRFHEVVPFGGVLSTDSDPLGTVQEAVERWGMAGLKFHPLVQRFSPGQPALAPAFEYLNERGKGVYIHTGYDRFYAWESPLEDVARLVATYPKIGFALPHLAFPHLDWAFDLAERHSNVWLDVTGVLTTILHMERHDPDGPEFREAARLRAVVGQRIPPMRARVMFGTDHPVGSGSLEAMLEEPGRFDLDRDTLEQVMYATAQRFLDRHGTRDPITAPAALR